MFYSAFRPAFYRHGVAELRYLRPQDVQCAVRRASHKQRFGVQRLRQQLRQRGLAAALHPGEKTVLRRVVSDHRLEIFAQIRIDNVIVERLRRVLIDPKFFYLFHTYIIPI